MAIFDLDSQLTFYGSFHHNKVNVFIHIACVPVILMTAIMMGDLYSLPDFLTDSLENIAKLLSSGVWLQKILVPATLGDVIARLYSVFYIILSPIVGSILSIVLLAMPHLSRYCVSIYGRGDTFKGALATHVVCWIAQFIGHGVFEGRAPALLDNLVQALLLAPLFVVYEVLFMLGFFPKLQQRLEKNVQAELAKLNDKKTGIKSK